MADQVTTIPKPISDSIRKIRDTVKQIVDQYTQSEEFVENHLKTIFGKGQATNQQASLDKIFQRQTVLEKCKELALSFIEVCITDLQQRAVSPAIYSARLRLSNIHEFTRATSLGAIFDGLPSGTDSVAILQLLEAAVRSALAADYPGVLQILNETQLAVSYLATSPDRRIPNGSLRKTPRRASTRTPIPGPLHPKGIRATARDENQTGTTLQTEDDSGNIADNRALETEIQDEDATMTTSADEDEKSTQLSVQPINSMIQDWRSNSDDILKRLHDQTHRWIEETDADKVEVGEKFETLVIDHQFEQARFAAALGKILR
ncbi:hypothetical protein E4T39_02333 [Aureobasidium subglaciale]|nr:hypothetical protein E4T39_02333 [Aureobasidium subglaciale]